MKATSTGLLQRDGLRRLLVRLRAPIVVVGLLLLASFARGDWLGAGFAVSMLGELVQVWCFASLDKNATLAARGPYAMVRNPMYLGRFLLLFGFVMTLGNGWLLVAYTSAYWAYMDARVQREEAHLKPIFGAAYDDYCRRVRRFVPGWPATGERVAFWDWRCFRQNNAGRNLAITLVAWAALAAWVLTRG